MILLPNSVGMFPSFVGILGVNDAGAIFDNLPDHFLPRTFSAVPIKKYCIISKILIRSW